VGVGRLRDYENDKEIEAARIERVQQLNTVNLAQCASLQNLYRVIQKSLRDSDKAIDEIAYYQAFPVERKRAHERNEETIELFRTPPCPPNIVLSPTE
jgi:hypothetical protein